MPLGRVTFVNPRKTLQKIGNGSRNVPFHDMVRLVVRVWVPLVRINGSHHIFSHPQIPKLVNLQDVNGEAKPYQIRQVLGLVETCGLVLGGKA